MSVVPATLSPALDESPADAALYRKISWRLIPLLFASYMVAYLDRVNISFAQLQMKDALGFDAAVYGLGISLMFVGYFLFELPSNLLLERVGARKTLLRIMFLWGLAATATMAVQNTTQFYVARFFLGVFEAGFFPGIILYLTYWYPAALRGRVLALIMSAVVVVNIFAGPLCGATMKFLDGVAGLAGWQWLFLSQGVPAMILGLVAYFVLHDRPGTALWLNAAERQQLQRNLAQDQGVADTRSTRERLGLLLADPRFWGLLLMTFMLVGASYVMVFWVPTLIKSWGVNDVFWVGLYSAIPSLVGAVGMILMGRSSDRHQERRWHFLVAVLIAALGLWATTLTQGELWPSLLALSVAMFGIASSTPLSITAITDYLPPKLVGPGIAIATSTGILGGATSPFVTGRLNAATGTTLYSIYYVMLLFVASGLLLLWLLPPQRSGPGH